MIAENLAASSVPGFKKQSVSFSTIEAGVLGAGSDSMAAQRNPSLLPTPNFGTDFKQGEMKATQVNNQIALNGPGFLSVQLPNGQTGYIRDGEFHVSQTGQLLNKDNFELIGDGGPIQVDARNSEGISISQSGEVGQGLTIRGRLSIVEFPNTNQLQRIAGGYYVAKPNAQPVPTTGGTGVLQGFMEMSNAVPMIEMGNLLLALRHFEANQRVIQMQDERMGKTIQELSTTS